MPQVFGDVGPRADPFPPEPYSTAATNRKRVTASRVILACNRHTVAACPIPSRSRKLSVSTFHLANLSSTASSVNGKTGIDCTDRSSLSPILGAASSEGCKYELEMTKTTHGKIHKTSPRGRSETCMDASSHTTASVGTIRHPSQAGQQSLDSSMNCTLGKSPIEPTTELRLKIDGRPS